MPKYHYKYEHTNGEIITKPAIVCESGGETPESYFNSPFVKRWWKEEIADEQGKSNTGTNNP